jgi:phosphocarrier protein HPr
VEKEIKMVDRHFIITSHSGLHARLATAMVQAAEKFDADIQLAYNGRKVNVKSIMGVMSLGITHGAKIKISAHDTDETEALMTMEDTIKKEGLGD